VVNRTNNDNGTGNVVLTHNYNNNTNDKYERARKVERIADQLVEKFGNDKYRDFYCKVAWRLSEARIWQHFEAAKKANPTAPGKLFSYLVKKDGV
jgi:hypothetical protein